MNVTLRDGRTVPLEQAICMFDGTYISINANPAPIDAYLTYEDYRNNRAVKAFIKDCYLLYDGTYVVRNCPDIVKLYSCDYAFKQDDDIAYDHYYGKYNFKDDMYEGYVPRTPTGVRSMGWFSDHAPYIEIDEEYYMDENTASEHGCWYCNSCDCWRHPGEGCCDCNSDNHVAGYHHLERIDKRKRGWSFGVGIEIEKEDYKVRKQLNWRDIYHEWGWCIEQDGSLDDEDGFEAISPILDLFDIETVDKHLNHFSNIVNAEYSGNCGGHIHISKRNVSTDDLFEELSPYYPLLFALYPSRINRSYSHAYNKNRMKDAGKYSSVARHHHTVEFRIFPSPKSLSVLQWRLDLLRLMVTTPMKNYEEVVDAMLNTKSLLFKHLVKIFATPKRYVTKIKQTIDFCKQFENIDIMREEQLKSLEKILYKLYKSNKKKNKKEKK